VSRFIELSLKRASVTLLIAVALVAGGVYATLNINQELTPDLEFPIITIITQAPGAAAEDVAEQVTIPLETGVAGTNGLRNLNTVSADNVSIMVAQFDFGHDMLQAEQQISSGVAGAQISDNAGTPNVSRLNLNQTLPVVQFSLSGDLEIPELERIALQQIEPEIRTITDVQNVDVLGGLERRLLIRFDPETMRERGITADQISGILEANNISLPAGDVGTAGESQSVRVDSRFETIEEIESLIVGVDDSDEEMPISVQLSDVATVETEDTPAGSISRTNGLPSVGIAVTKTQDGNTVDVSTQVVETLEEIEGNLPEGVEIDIILDQSVFIEEAITGLSRDALIGAAGAVLAVWVMLLSFRSAIIAGVSIPLSVLFAITILYFQGFTLNILTLGGLAIAIGRVVDDSIVVLENVYRHMQEGDEIDSAIVAGAREIAVPVIGSTLTAIGVFVPLIFASGIAGVLFRPFALTVTIALLASTVVALTIVPVVARLWIGRSALGTQREETRDSLLQRLYTPVLRWSLTHRLITVLLAISLFVGSLGLLAIIPTTLLPEEGDPEFSISVSLPPGIGTSEEVIERALEAEEVVADLPGIDVYNTSITLGGGSDVFSLGRALTGAGTRGVDFFIQLDEDADAPEIRDLARERLEALDDDLIVSIQGSGDQSQNQLQLSVVGDDEDQVREVAGEVLESIRGVEGLEDLTSAATATQNEIIIDVNPDAALGVNLTAAEVAQQVRQLIVGQDVTSVQLNDEEQELTVVLTAGAGELESIEDLGNILLGPPEQPVPLSEIAELREETGPAQVTRENQRVAGIIQGQISGRETGEVQNDIDDQIAAMDLPDGISIEYGGALQQFEEGFEQLILGIGAAIVIVYVVMVIVMGSLVYPFIIMFTLPLTSIGALTALALTGRPLSLAALFGLLMLVGIVVANGIVLIDFINQLRDRKARMFDALMEGGRLRVRPVLMTALSTILALLPMSLGLTEGAEIASDLAIVVIGGLISSTLLTLVVVPVIYSLIESLRDRVTGGDDGGDGGGHPSPNPERGPQPHSPETQPVDPSQPRIRTRAPLRPLRPIQ
jgi:hydrophobic/amphiphilic exporter-1 (mainly G- bacteria), HAE1 family